MMTTRASRSTFADKRADRHHDGRPPGLRKDDDAARSSRATSQKEGKKPLLVAADMQRPAAVEQLKVLGEQIDVPVFNIPGESPVDDLRGRSGRGEEARPRRHHLRHRRPPRDRRDAHAGARRDQGEPLAREHLPRRRRDDRPGRGEDGARPSTSASPSPASCSTKLDGDARGGAALSVKEVTGAPVLFAGMGETTDKFEEFRADGMASRILGMGDVVGLMQDFEEVVDKKKADEDAARMLQGEFTLDDFLEQVRMIQKMGSLQDLVDKIPMLGGHAPARA